MWNTVDWNAKSIHLVYKYLIDPNYIQSVRVLEFDCRSRQEYRLDKF